MEDLKKKNQKGFTLIEMATVIVISGLLLSGFFSAYQFYMKDYRPKVTYDRLKKLDGMMQAFYLKHNRYPCPSGPKYSITSTKSGVEDCSKTTAGCHSYSGVCLKEGRDTGFNKETGTPTVKNYVMMGSIPYKTLMLGLEDETPEDGFFEDSNPDENIVSASAYGVEDVLDGWGRQITYAVTQSLTIPGTPVASSSAISVITEDHRNLSQPEGSVPWVALSYGDNGIGAYDQEGDKKPCPVAGNEFADGILDGIITKAGTRAIISNDFINCNAWNTYQLYVSFAAANSPTVAVPAIPVQRVTFMNGVRSMAEGINYFDDILYYASSRSASYWRQAKSDYVFARSSSKKDIVNTNVGFVGIGTNYPRGTLHVEGRVKVKGVNVKSLCNIEGKDCFSAVDIAGTDTLQKLNCFDHGMYGIGISAVKGISKSTVGCEDTTLWPSIDMSSNCLVDEYAVGLRVVPNPLGPGMDQAIFICEAAP